MSVFELDFEQRLLLPIEGGEGREASSPCSLSSDPQRLRETKLGREVYRLPVGQ